MIRENLQQPECTAAPHLTHQHSDGQQPDHQNKCWQSSDTDVNVVCSLVSLSSALVSFRHKNHLVRKTSWFSLKRLFDLQKLSCELFAVYFEISSCFYIYTSLSWATGAAALLPISESVTWPKTRRLPVNMLSRRPGWMFRQLAWFLLVIQEI